MHVTTADVARIQAYTRNIFCYLLMFPNLHKDSAIRILAILILTITSITNVGLWIRNEHHVVNKGPRNMKDYSMCCITSRTREIRA